MVLCLQYLHVYILRALYIHRPLVDLYSIQNKKTCFLFVFQNRMYDTHERHVRYDVWKKLFHTILNKQYIYTRYHRSKQVYK